MIAICFNCGSDKADPRATCGSCKLAPSSLEDFGRSLALTDFYLTRSQLDVLAAALRSGNRDVVPQDVIDQNIQAILKDEGVRAHLASSGETSFPHASALMSALPKESTSRANEGIITWVPQVVTLAVLAWAFLPGNPYSYFAFLRLVCFGSFAFLCFRYFRGNEGWLASVFGLFSLIYNPFWHVSLSRSTWLVVNIATMAALISSLYWELKNRSSRSENTGGNTQFKGRADDPRLVAILDQLRSESFRPRIQVMSRFGVSRAEFDTRYMSYAMSLVMSGANSNWNDDVDEYAIEIGAVTRQEIEMAKSDFATAVLNRVIIRFEDERRSKNV